MYPGGYHISNLGNRPAQSALGFELFSDRYFAFELLSTLPAVVD